MIVGSALAVLRLMISKAELARRRNMDGHSGNMFFYVRMYCTAGLDRVRPFLPGNSQALQTLARIPL